MALFNDQKRFALSVLVNDQVLTVLMSLISHLIAVLAPPLISHPVAVLAAHLTLFGSASAARFLEQSLLREANTCCNKNACAT
jgi:hypothetical protein